MAKPNYELVPENQQPKSDPQRIADLEKQLSDANNTVQLLKNSNEQLQLEVEELDKQTVDPAEYEAFHKEVDGFRKLQEGVKNRELKLKEYEQSLTDKHNGLEVKEKSLNEQTIKLKDKEALVQKSEIRYTELIIDEQTKIKNEAFKLAYKSRLLEYKRLNFIERIFVPPPRRMDMPFKILCLNCGKVFEVSL